MPVILPDVNSVVRIAFESSVGPARMTNVLHFLFTGGPSTQTAIDAVAVRAELEWRTLILAGMANTVKFDQVVVQDLTSRVSPVSVVPSGTTSGLTGASAPINCALVMSHKIARRYRGGHPRTYLSGLRQVDFQDSTTWTAAIQSGYLSAWDSFIANMLSGTYTPISLAQFVNVSYFSGKALRVTPVVDFILDSDPKAGVGTQRRRVRTGRP